MQTKTKRITISLNPKLISDAQILSAFQILGGEAPGILKLLALVGINSNPSLAGTMAQAVSISIAAKKVDGKGFSQEKKQSIRKVADAKVVIEDSSIDVEKINTVKQIIVPDPIASVSIAPAASIEMSLSVTAVKIAAVLTPEETEKIRVMQEETGTQPEATGAVQHKRISLTDF